MKNFHIYFKIKYWLCLNILFQAHKKFSFYVETEKSKQVLNVTYFFLESAFRFFFSLFSVAEFVNFSIPLFPLLLILSHFNFFQFFFSPVSGLLFIAWTPLTIFYFCPSIPLFSQTHFSVFYRIAELFQYEICFYMS